jgi:hypothetical protein
MPEAAFYAYAAPEPPGFKTARVGPSAAFYSPDFNQFLIKYDDVRRAASPRAALLDFPAEHVMKYGAHGKICRAVALWSQDCHRRNRSSVPLKRRST